MVESVNTLIITIRYHFMHCFCFGHNLLLLFSAMFFTTLGCAMTSPARKPLIADTVFLPNSNLELAWEQVVDVIHQFHFEIEEENKLAGTITTKYRVGSGILEPWHPDAANMTERWQNTLQSMRRQAIFTLSQTADGVMVQVAVRKELEDRGGSLPPSVGDAPFDESQPLPREFDLVGSDSAPTGWIFKGRDHALENKILARLSHEK